ncbi:MAG TPA: DNA polymerase III subunit [Pyrinomonadaceae bacterium]
MFDQLTGNERVKQVLERMLESGRLPGALLFSGEEGVGKKLFALELARALNCRSPNGVQGCGKCSACKRIWKFNYPASDDPEDWKSIIWTDHGDVGMVVAPKRLLLVDQMRQIEREANYRPFEGRARVFLVEDADKLNEPSANALLKILEEPPPTSHVILLTARPAMLLPTIRSRCQVIRFAPLTAKEIEQHLLQNALASPDEATLRSRVAAGSLGRALASDVAEFTRQRTAMLEVLKAVAVTGDRARLLRSSEHLSEAALKDEYETRLEILETLIRDVLAVSLGSPEAQLVNIDLLAELREIAKKVTAARATEWISQIEELREQLIVNINRKPATDALFLAMAAV